MDIKLSIPLPEQSANLTVETRPRQVQEWLDALPFANLGETSRKLRDALASVNRFKLNEEARLKLLEIYRATIYQVLPDLESLFSGKPLPLPEKSKQTANVSRELLVELANGYKIVLSEYLNRRMAFGGGKQLPIVIQRAMESLSKILTVCYETYGPTPAGVWSEMHQLYRYALHHNIQDESVDANGDATSINITYKQALLLALADPYRLMHGEVHKILDYLAQFSERAQLVPIGPAQGTAGLFLVRLDSDKPPKALSHNSTGLDPATDIILNTIELARLLHQQILNPDSDLTVHQFKATRSAKDPGYVDLMKRLLKHWGIAPKRVFNRVETGMQLQICSGIRAVHYFLNGEKPFIADNPASDDDIHVDASESGSPQAQQSYSAATWTVLNESAGGLALRKEPDSPAEMRVGEIIGVKAEDSETWAVGVVRWVHSKNGNDLELGAQMLAPKATPISLIPSIGVANERTSPALLLPEIAALKQPPTLIAGRGLFQRERELVLEQATGSPMHVRASALVEFSAHFDMFHFKPSS